MAVPVRSTSAVAKRPSIARFTTLPSFGLLYSVVLGSVLIPTVLVFIYVWGYDHQSVGIRVQLLRSIPSQALGDSSSWPLVVRIDNSGLGSPPRLYLNSRPLAAEQLGRILAAELKSRSERVVYVQASRDVEWKDAVGAMEIVRGAGAKVVLLTEEATSHHP